MLQSSSVVDDNWSIQLNVSKLFSELKLVTDNFLSIYAEANWEATEICNWDVPVCVYVCVVYYSYHTQQEAQSQLTDTKGKQLIVVVPHTQAPPRFLQGKNLGMRLVVPLI